MRVLSLHQPFQNLQWGCNEITVHFQLTLAYHAESSIKQSRVHSSSLITTQMIKVMCQKDPPKQKDQAYWKSEPHTSTAYSLLLSQFNPRFLCTISIFIAGCCYAHSILQLSRPYNIQFIMGNQECIVTLCSSGKPES